jgi:hypothetical protein
VLVSSKVSYRSQQIWRCISAFNAVQLPPPPQRETMTLLRRNYLDTFGSHRLAPSWTDPFGAHRTILSHGLIAFRAFPLSLVLSKPLLTRKKVGKRNNAPVPMIENMLGGLLILSLITVVVALLWIQYSRERRREQEMRNGDIC